ncbi:hypothetical protein P0D88_16735 [Paraburkholderia sp. RL18-103-BIB-C]|uniref:hypothetical protein n=1 Tax=Paraburkholderia sp. RL18-103-BIB-C TaxID=3031637 RepID=UPI0038BB5979
MAKRKLMLPPGYVEGMHFLAIGKETVAGPFATSAEACQAKDEMFPTGRHPESGLRVDTIYHPTRKQLRKWERQDRALAAFYVTYWRVVEDRKTEHGRCIGAPLSRMFSTRQECRKALAQIKGGNPRAYMGGGTYLFNWRSPRDIAARKSMLDEIRGIAA